VRNGLIAGVFADDQRVRSRAYLRSVTNVGLSVGALFGGLALVFDTRAAYQGALLLNAAGCLVVAVLLRGLPKDAAVPVEAVGVETASDRRATPTEPAGRAAGVLRDTPYLVVTALTSLITVHFVVLEITLPLWVVGHTDAPRWMVTVLLLINTVVISLAQVRFSRGTETPGSAAAVFRSGGLVLGAACLVWAGAGQVRGALPASIVLVLGAAIHVVGELLTSAGQWGVQMGLAPDGRQGEYQGLSTAGFSVAAMIGPVATTILCLAWGAPGWVVLGTIFAVAAAATVPATDRAERSRP
jgi:hypothetical protein